MARPKITVLGSANTDFVVQLKKLPKPGETVLGSDLVTAQGGKGANQAVALHRLGAEVGFIACLGDDSLGGETLLAFSEEGLSTDSIERIAGAPSGVALILVEEGGENVIAVAPGANSRLTPEIVETNRQAIQESAALVTQLEVPMESVERALAIAHAAGVLTVLNPAPAPSQPLPDEFYRLVDVINPNRTEATALTGITITDEESAVRAARELLRRGVKLVALTLGAEGALLVDEGGAKRIPAFRVRAIDATGAGDAFTAGLALALARGDDYQSAARFASAVGALAATKVGAQPSLPSLQAVEELIRTQSAGAIVREEAADGR